MENARDWALPFCITAWLLAFHAGASDEPKRLEPLFTGPIQLAAAPDTIFDTNEDHQQFIQDGILIDVRTSIVNGHGLRRRFVHGMARNTGAVTFPRAALELLEAPIVARAPGGQAIPGNFEVAATQFLGDLDPGRAISVALSLERPSTRIRVYQIRVRSLP